MTSAKFSTSMEAQQAAVLLEGYHFELGQHDARQWVALWLESYRPNWIRDAVIEALYQGRYKSISVKQILELWQRRGQPIRHATHEFEAAVCREFGEVRLAPIPPEKLSAQKSPQKHYRSIARSNPSQSSQDNVQQSNAQNTVDVSNAQSFNPHRHKRNAAVSFDLAALPPASPGMTARGEAVLNNGQKSEEHADKHSEEKPKAEIRDNRDWREFPAYTTPTYSASSPDEVLRAQRQFNGVLYSSARAIQPFKPALPFSAQTLRLAKQKAIGLMSEAQQQAQRDMQREFQQERIAELQR